MFQLRNFFNVAIRVYRQPVIQKTLNHRQLFSTKAITPLTYNVNENAFAHTVLKANPKSNVFRGEQNEKIVVVQSTEIDFDQNWEDLTAGGIVESLKTIVNYCKLNGTTISDDRFDKFVDVCTERCFDFTDDQLIASLQILAHHPQVETPKSKNFFELWSAFDDACIERIDEWDIDKILFVSDHWQMLRLGKFNKFTFRGSFKVGRKLRSLPSHQLVQLMFYLSIKQNEKLDMFEIEMNLVRSLDDFSLNDIAVVCLGFFKTQTKLKSLELIKKIYERTIREIDTVESTALTCILKTLGHSCVNSHAALVREMLNAVAGQLSRLSSLTCLHVALLGTHLDICHQGCVEQMLLHFSDNLKSIRINDFERISNVIGVFDFESESKVESRLCQQILAELKNRVDEITQYPKYFIRCLHYLTLKGYCDEEMISVALSKPLLKLAYLNQTIYDVELFSLDSYAKVNLKETYTGNALTEKSRRCMGKMLTDYIPDRSKEFKINFVDNILLEIKETSEELCTHSYFVQTLPHFRRADILIAYDKRSNTTIDISNNLPPHYTGKIIDRSMLVGGLDTDAENVEIVSIIAGGWNNYIRDTQKLNGYAKQKIEQSKIIGLRPVLISWFDWNNVQKTDRQSYVKLRIDEALRQK